jgi:hypothetical protein
MRTRWHKWWLLAMLVSACGLNPQPDIPSGSATGSNPPPMGAAGSRNGGSDGGSLSTSAGGASPVVAPGVGGGLEVADGGDQGASAGDSGMSEGGASEAGAAGADQLAPGPAK